MIVATPNPFRLAFATLIARATLSAWYDHVNYSIGSVVRHG